MVLRCKFSIFGDEVKGVASGYVENLYYFGTATISEGYPVYKCDRID